MAQRTGHITQESRGARDHNKNIDDIRKEIIKKRNEIKKLIYLLNTIIPVEHVDVFIVVAGSATFLCYMPCTLCHLAATEEDAPHASCRARSFLCVHSRLPDCRVVEVGLMYRFW